MRIVILRSKKLQTRSPKTTNISKKEKNKSKRIGLELIKQKKINKKERPKIKYKKKNQGIL